MARNTNRSLGRPPNYKHKQPTNERILKKASQLFLENSYQGVSMDDVAKACDVTKASVYYYYKTKSELYTEAMIELMYRVQSQIVKLLREEEPFYTRLLNVAEAYLSVSIDLDTERFIYSAKNMVSNHQLETIQNAEESMYHAMEDYFKEAIDQEEILPINPTFAVHAYISLLQTGHYKNGSGNAIFPSSKEAATQIVRFFWKGLTN
ncbi:TetR/AcrR family transcriptional regulator [Halobacillus shinanisalinarum]|uniref:TetR/AcrR family transcriptional regulator n=1 Tax=Halobacillus shinanisalinarum TaxID=2932258 RepID=A0ABY4H4Q6_9BACI|nr:TetR/AcrR family transcriptional regulator [Halobacillus shinanisalinarum]UOQ95148.1 TetR/AcrR family transcriptional regulator [Halobacillus shinanisalinarum]